MKSHVLSSLLLASLPLIGCATEVTEDQELDETLYDNAPADSFSYPSDFGKLFQQTWQYGELSPSESLRNPAWKFTLDGNATIKVTTRKAPEADEDLTLTRSVVYLYKLQSSGVWKRLAKSDVTGAFGKLTRDLGDGEYRVLVKGVQGDDGGDFMLRMDCTGAGCADGPQCLFGDDYYTVSEAKRGAIHSFGRSVLTPTSTINAASQAQIIAAVNESSHNVSTLAEAFAAVDGSEINRDTYSDNLGGRSIKAFEYGAGDNSYGAIFVDSDPTPVAAIHDGEIDECTLFVQACVFGRQGWEADHMPNMKVTNDYTFKQASAVPAALKAQLIEATSYEGNVPTLAEAFENADENTFYVATLRHTDGREFVAVRYYAGDTAVGSFFAKGLTARLAEINDSEVTDCKAF